MKPKYDAVILVIASQDSDVQNTRYIIERLKPEWKPLYSFMKSIWLQYFQINPNIKVVFVYGGGEKEFEVQDHDWIFPEVFENNHPGIIDKTMKSMKKAVDLYDFDYLIRTNLSTFWDINKLHSRLQELPKTKCLTGTEIKSRDTFGNSYHYIAGFDLVMSRDLVEAILPYTQDIVEQKVYCNMEDLSICTAVKKYLNVGITSSNKSQALNISMSPFNLQLYRKTTSFLMNGFVDHVRVKTRIDRNADKQTLSTLLHDVYGKSIL